MKVFYIIYIYPPIYLGESAQKVNHPSHPSAKRLLKGLESKFEDDGVKTIEASGPLQSQTVVLIEILPPKKNLSTPGRITMKLKETKSFAAIQPAPMFLRFPWFSSEQWLLEDEHDVTAWLPSFLTLHPCIASDRRWQQCQLTTQIKDVWESFQHGGSWSGRNRNFRPVLVLYMPFLGVTVELRNISLNMLIIYILCTQALPNCALEGLPCNV